MHRWLAAIAVTFAIPMAASAALVITEVQPQTTAGTASTVNGDWWELTNTGSTAIDLSGYMWADEEDRIHAPLSPAGADPNGFPSFTIDAGESIIILDEPSSNEAAWRTNWGLPASLDILSSNEMIDLAPVSSGGAFSGLSSDGDSVYFYSPAGDLLSSYIYGAPITRGTTFEANTGGADLGLSVIGENGAYQADGNGDIGSPGFAAVPEPATIFAMIVAVSIGLIARRSR